MHASQVRFICLIASKALDRSSLLKAIKNTTVMESAMNRKLRSFLSPELMCLSFHSQIS